STRRENERLRKENEQLRRREKQLEREQEQLRQEQERLRQERERLRQENERLKRQLEEAQRANKRQAAPFSRGQRKVNPRPPGRKPGAAYGQRFRKAIPEQVDEVIAVPTPARCPCGGTVELEKVKPQYQHEVVRKTIWRRFDIAIGCCRRCGRRVQGRDPRQTSDALGAAAVQLGPQALALAVKMNKGLGMPHGDVAAVLQDGFGLPVHRSTICRAVERVARRGEATWHALRDAARRSMRNAIDETGWKVEAQLLWLWVVVSEQVTYCDILPGRGFEQAAELLGADYDGWLTHDGWAVYYKFLRAGHQSCIAHLLRRCRDMAAVASRTAARFPLQVKALLEKGLALRDRYNQGKLSLHGLWTATGRLEAQLDRLLLRPYRDSANRRLKNHLWRERPYLFTFLYCPGLDATNNAAERALRPLVVARKNWGGNRTQKGARAQAVLTSILETARQQGKNPLEVLIALLVGNDQVKILDLVPPRREIPQDSSPAPPPRGGVAHRLLGPSKTEFAVPLELVALYAAQKAVDGTLVSVQP
ncbi:MAG TPA: IS66 family transposase, partial [Candidatus Acidoferrales bacterium]|nr:IS66 family transposase [Candidatus Acidoferrales bacterium]